MLRLTIFSLILGLLVGCSDQADPGDALAKANESNIQRLANLYLAYQSDNNWVGPPDEAAFKEFIKAYSPKKLERIGIDPAQVDQLFVSERDSQPFKIRYKVVGNMMGSTEPVIFEAAGVGGQRMVGFLNMSQREVDAAEYDSLWAGKGATAATTRSN
jgi:hypothetical protein